MDRRDIKNWLSIYLKGFAMGSADAVPGVSGGTIALITGIYERLIEAVTSINHVNGMKAVESLRKRDLNGVKEVFRDVNGGFLTVLGLGIISAIILVLRFVHLLLQEYPIPTFGFFFGLIAVSVLVLWREVDVSTNKNKVMALTGFLVAFLTSGYAASFLGHGLPVVFLSGAVAVSAMILPGISGSLILMILGQYEYMSGALTKFTDALVTAGQSGNLQNTIESSTPVFVFVVGAFVGLFTVAHAVRRALERQREATMAFLVSLVAGALRAPIVEVEKALVESGVSWSSALPEFIPAALVGGVFIYALDRKAGML